MKKTIKKKIDEMTEEEVEQVKDRFCKDDVLCADCPLNTTEFPCLVQFPFWKKMYESYKDKEFDVEVEGND